MTEVWKSVVHASYELVTMTWQRWPTQFLLGVFGELRRTDIKLSDESEENRVICRRREIKDTGQQN